MLFVNGGYVLTTKMRSSILLRSLDRNNRRRRSALWRSKHASIQPEPDDVCRR
jgi:hypothetical protein